MIITPFFIFILGMIFGSFIANYTYRVVRNKDMGGRSICDHCGKKLRAVDNIPIISYFLLKGKSGCCKKEISARYPLIETATATGFVAMYSLEPGSITAIQNLIGDFQILYLPLLLFLFLCTLSIFIIDLEHQIIPDEIVFTIFFVILTMLMIGQTFPYTALTYSFVAGSFFLMLNLITKGRGMGLGDAKLALALGLVLGTLTLIWVGLSFVLGAVIAVILLIFGKAKFGKHIAFGPYMILAFWIVLMYGQQINQLILYGQQ